MTPTPAADVFKWVNHQRRDDREKPNHGTDQRQMADQCPSTAFLEIEDSKARSERMASHTHLSHLMSPSPPEEADPFVARTVFRRNKILVGTPSGRCTGGIYQ